MLRKLNMTRPLMKSLRTSIKSINSMTSWLKKVLNLLMSLRKRNKRQFSKLIKKQKRTITKKSKAGISGKNLRSIQTKKSIEILIKLDNVPLKKSSRTRSQRLKSVKMTGNHKHQHLPQHHFHK